MTASARELGVEVDAVADIADDEKRRAAFRRGQRGDVFAGLVVGALENLVEGGSAALAVAGLFAGLVRNEVEQGAFLGGFGKGALFGFR